jgi:predicted negative regulator of RcsB-dependent stress response
MARKESAAGHTLEEIQSTADRMAEWIRENVAIVVGGVAALLILTGSLSYLGASNEKKAEAATAALELARMDYHEALGAPLVALELPEFANPAVVAEPRAAFEARLGEIAETHAGTAGATLAMLEHALLLSEQGDLEAALERYDAALEAGISEGPLRGLTLQRAATVLENLSRWAEAADRHAQAAAIGTYPLRHHALADAARTRAAAGEPDRALELYERLELAAPELRLPDHQQAQLAELRAGR